MTTLSLAPAKSRHASLRRPLRIAAAALTAVALIAAAQEGTRQWTQAQMSRDATFAGTGTHDLRLLCTGAGETTYVLEAGATGFAETWTWVQDALDDDARVCSYDRAGMGLSEPSPEGFEPGQTARDLHAALTDAGEAGPFVVVGHSLGGFFVRDFAAQFPGDTAAVVLVDSSHEDQLAAFGEDMVAQFRAFPGLLSALSGVSMTGILHLWNPLEAGAAGLEGDALTAASAFAGDRVHLATSAEELRHWDAITARAASQDLPAGLPLLAVTAGSPVPGSEDFSDLVEPLHREIAGRFTAGAQVTIEDADHFSILMNRDHALVLAQLVTDYVGRTVAPE
ncbi:alpha/beta hydrolase [Roseibacterium sp. SDUM158017]|uniref:alpha/beta fold hydrolase n=1 Tax=Roseicyclus salinarum TaxID=3036773 RepID=UPI002415175F|nr:alpha/beta hydrolase [Roseibacterium sp. SDUM158017]MDG4650362.1 alpha/beta hydrolase [Roseibacterium sp. SDUM158017]